MLDRLNARQANKELKEELIYRMGSDEMVITKEAIRMLQHKKWLYDGSLKGKNFREATLTNAHLSRANLQKAIFYKANLQRAVLRHTDLNSANLWRSNLRDTRLKHVLFSEKTILPDKSNWTPDTDMTRFTNPDHPEFWQPEWAKDGD